MTIRTTHANGIAIDDYECKSSSAARRFAATVDRDHPAVDKVESAAGDGVCVKIVGDLGEGRGETLLTPDGWTVDHINVVNGGATFVYYVPEGGA